LVEEKKKPDSEFLSYNLMLNSGKKNSRFVRQKNKYSNSRVKSEYPKKTIKLSQVTDKLYHIMLMLYQVDLAMSRIRTHNVCGDRN
jgi:hypothetical protein